MKKTIITLAITTLIGGALLTNCQSTATKVENAQEEVQDAQENMDDAQNKLNQVRHDSIAQFKKESLARITAHQKSISDFKARIKNEKKENRAKYEKKLAELENKNDDLKKRLDDYKANSKIEWTSFKNKVNSDLDKVEETLKSLTD